MRRVALLMVPLAAAGGCATDHDALARRDRDESDSAGSSAAAAGQGGESGGAGGAAGAADARSDLPVEPEGETAITLVHGVVDAARLRFCFSRVQADVTLPPVGDPVPAPGLGYGEAVALSSLPAVDPLVDDILPVVLAAQGSELDGLDCEQALHLAQTHASTGAGGAAAQAAGAGGQLSGIAAAAGASGVYASAGAAGAAAAGAAGAGGQLLGVAAAAGAAGAAGGGGEGVPPPPVRAWPLPLIPRRTLTQGSSFLLVARGCLGGGTLHSGPDQEQICGTGYAPSRPTLAPVLVRLSRLSQAELLGLQVVHASSEPDELDVRSVANASSRTIATKVVPGAIAPRAPELDHPARYYGALTPDATLEVVRHSSSGPVHAESWQSALASSGLDAVVDGRTYALVVMGPALAVDAAGWHHPAHVAVVPTDPSVE